MQHRRTATSHRDRGRSSAYVLGLVVCLCLFGGVPTASAAQPEEGETRAGTGSTSSEKVVVEPEGLEATRPDGWVEGKPGEGAVALLRPAGISGAQIEIRVSTPIDSTEAAAFFTAFHNELKAAGFNEVNRIPNAVYGSIGGNEIEYEGRTRGLAYRLIVWQFHRDESAWLVVGFFPVGQRDRLYEDFRRLARSMEF